MGGFTSSINTGLQAVPDLTDIQSVGKLSFQFIQLYNAVSILQQAIDNYTGNTPVGSSSSQGTPEQTVLVGNTSNMWCVAGENINAGFLVGFYNVSGVTNAKLALAGGGSRPPVAHGLSMNSVSTGGQLQVLLFGLFNFGGSVIPGTTYCLSPSVPGGLATFASITTGQSRQPIGFGVDTNSIFLNPNMQPVTLVAGGSGSLS